MLKVIDIYHQLDIYYLAEVDGNKRQSTKGKAFMSDLYFVDCCSPTLASIKCGSLFNCCFEDRNDFINWTQNYCKQFCRFGLRLLVLRVNDHNALIYLFRISQLRKMLCDPSNIEFLWSFGYPDNCSQVYPCLQYLKKRVQSSHVSDFPHEIGLFLGYPLKDVSGFIQNHGQNCKLLGTWKVYGDVEIARSCFTKYQKCRRVYSDLWLSGKRSILELTVPG